MASEQEQQRIAESAMPLMEHLRELRRRLITGGVSVALGVVVCFFFAPDIWDFLVAPMNDALRANDAGTMAILAPLEGVVTYLKVAVASGFFAATPVIAWQVWAFVGPGLYAKEKRVLLPLAIASTLLFLGGAGFGYFVIFEYAFGFFLSVTSGTAEAVMSMESYLKTATRLLLAFGLSFQLPVVVFFLARIGLIDARDMIRGFKYSIVGIFVVAAIITPPDILTQGLMAAPLVLLYGVGILIAAVVSTKKREA
jgi:sec-independent protein translocase protein TatC